MYFLIDNLNNEIDWFLMKVLVTLWTILAEKPRQIYFGVDENLRKFTDLELNVNPESERQRHHTYSTESAKVHGTCF